MPGEPIGRASRCGKPFTSQKSLTHGSAKMGASEGSCLNSTAPRAERALAIASILPLDRRDAGLQGHRALALVADRRRTARLDHGRTVDRDGVRVALGLGGRRLRVRRWPRVLCRRRRRDRCGRVAQADQAAAVITLFQTAERIAVRVEPSAATLLFTGWALTDLVDSAPSGGALPPSRSTLRCRKYWIENR